MHCLDVRADLAQRDGKQVQLLEANCLIGRDEHSAALVELDKVRLRLDLGCRNACALGYLHEHLVLLGGNRINASVIHRIDGRRACRNLRQHIVFLHALFDCARNILREQDARVHRAEEFFHRVRVRTLCVDIKSLELALEGVRALERRALVVFARVERFENLRKRLAALAVHALFQLYMIKTHCYAPFLL